MIGTFTNQFTKIASKLIIIFGIINTKFVANSPKKYLIQPVVIHMYMYTQVISETCIQGTSYNDVEIILIVHNRQGEDRGHINSEC